MKVMKTKQRIAVVEALSSAGGEIVDKKGFATRKLFNNLGDNYSGSETGLRQLLSGMEKDGLLVRDTHGGKRTYKITLSDNLDSRWDDHLVWHESIDTDGNPEPTVEKEIVDTRVDSSIDYDDLAESLLAKVASILTHDSSEYEHRIDALVKELELSRSRQHNFLSESDKWRKRAHELENELVSAKSRIEGLSNQVAVLNSNIDAMKRDSSAQASSRRLNEDSRKTLERLIRERPHIGSGG